MSRRRLHSLVATCCVSGVLAAVTSCVGDDPSSSSGIVEPGTADGGSSGDGSTTSDGSPSNDADGGAEDSSTGDTGAKGVLHFRSTLSGAGAKPPTGAAGTAVVVLTFYEATSKLCGTATYNALGFTPFSAHVHNRNNSFDRLVFNPPAPAGAPFKLNATLSAAQVANLMANVYDHVDIESTSKPEIGGVLGQDPGASPQACE
jgi:hypothetical protein